MLCYEGVQKSKQGNKPNKLIKWKKILDNEGEVPSCPQWMDAEKVQLQMGDMAFRRFVDGKKKEASAVYLNMSVDER